MGVPWFSQLEGAHRCNGKSLFCQKNEQNVLRRAIKCQVWSCGACKTSCVYSHNHTLWKFIAYRPENARKRRQCCLIPWAYAEGTFLGLGSLFFAADSSCSAQTYFRNDISRLNMLVIWKLGAWRRDLVMIWWVRQKSQSSLRCVRDTEEGKNCDR